MIANVFSSCVRYSNSVVVGFFCSSSKRDLIRVLAIEINRSPDEPVPEADVGRVVVLLLSPPSIVACPSP